MQAAIRSLVSKAAPDLHEVNDVAASIARMSAGTLIADLSANKREAVRRLMMRAFKEGWSDATLQQRIAATVGLDSRYVDAVENLRQRIIAGGGTEARANKEAKAYADRLRTHRAAVIARTETRDVLARAQRELWTQQQEDGDLSPYAVRVTHVHAGGCAQHCRKENGRRRSLKRGKDSGGPPFHPNCQCWEEVEDQGILKTAHHLIGDIMTISKAITPGGRVGDASSLDASPKKNWVENAGGLPKYIRMVAHALIRSGKDKSRAISMAIGIVKNWAEGKGKVSPKVRAAAAKAIAEWEAKKAKAHVSKAAATTWDLVAWQEARAQLHRDGII